MYVAVFAFKVRTSGDGINWTDPGRDAGLAEDAAWFDAVVAAGPGFIAYGRTCEGGGDFSDIEPFPCYQEAGIWVSSDGVAWTMVSRSDQFQGCAESDEAPCHSSVDWVGEGPDGLLAYGYDAGGPAVWTSPDAMVWTRGVAVGLLCEIGPCTPIARFGDRMIVFQMEETWTDDCMCLLNVDAYGFESTDGVEWTPLTDGPTFAGARVTDVAVSAGILVAVGSGTAWLLGEDAEWAGVTLDSGDAGHLRLLPVPDGFLVLSDGGNWHYTEDGGWVPLWFPEATGEDAMGYPPFRHFTVGPSGELVTGGWIWHRESM
jgi:hypothetical protein